MRVTEQERAALEALQEHAGGPRRLGPWLVWRALEGQPPPRGIDGVMPGPGIAGPNCGPSIDAVMPGRGLVMPGRPGNAAAGVPVSERLILDLCAGSGAWSAPYEEAGYQVIRVTLPEGDVRTYVPPPNVWGVLAAPPCTEFSGAKRTPRDLVRGMECVNAVLRIVLQARPVWWALENPANGAHLVKFLGPPRDSWEPCDFGDPWTKRTAVWGEYQIPRRGPFVVSSGSAMDRSTAAERAITPPGFARAFFLANP